MPTPGMPEPPVAKQSLRMPKKQKDTPTPKPPQDDELVSQMKNGNVKEELKTIKKVKKVKVVEEVKQEI
jgi:hypothetical protein